MDRYGGLRRVKVKVEEGGFVEVEEVEAGCGGGLIQFLKDCPDL